VQRLIALYPQLLRVHRRAGDGRWPQPAWDAAEAQSRAAGQRAVLASFDAQGGRFVILRAADPASFALEVDLQRAVPWADWPYDEAARSGPVRAVLGPDGGPAWRLHGDDAASAGPWPMAFSKHLAADSQPFDLRVAQSVGWSALPWGRMAAWAAVVAALAALAAAVQRQRAERQRAEELLRLGQVGAPEHAGRTGRRHGARAEPAADRAAGQHAGRAAPAGRRPARPGHRATEADGARHRSRRAARPTWWAGCAAWSSGPETPGPRCSPALDTALRHALDLLEPELKRLGRGAGHPPSCPPAVLADPVALEQIVHNLLSQRAAGAGARCRRRPPLRWQARAWTAQAQLRRCATTAPGSRPTRCRTCSSPSSPRAPAAWGWA
jgi:hypothetical protein